jgi:hypothetical protein
MPATHPMTLAREGTTLVIVDVQDRLFPAMDADHREEVMRNIKILATAARRLRLPCSRPSSIPRVSATRCRSWSRRSARRCSRCRR